MGNDGRIPCSNLCIKLIEEISNGIRCNVNYLEDAFWQIIISAGPVLIVALGIGLLIGIVQAATSINEMTLSFVPKLVLVLLTLALIANFMLTGLADYFAFIFDQIASIGQA